MTISWHCRECNSKGEQDISIEDILKNRVADEHVLNVIMRLIKHDCGNPKIGIKASA